MNIKNCQTCLWVFGSTYSCKTCIVNPEYGPIIYKNWIDKNKNPKHLINIQDTRKEFN